MTYVTFVINIKYLIIIIAFPIQKPLFSINVTPVINSSFLLPLIGNPPLILYYTAKMSFIQCIKDLILPISYNKEKEVDNFCIKWLVKIF